MSDTIHDALAEIEGYQQSMPECCDGLRGEIGKMKAVMDALRAYLDCPPSNGRYPRCDAAMTRLRTKIAGIDVSGIAAALENVRASWPTKEEFEKTEGFRPAGSGRNGASRRTPAHGEEGV